MSLPESIGCIEDEESLADLDVAVGDVLAGKYRVTRVLGSGGMGIVVEADHLELDEKVAIKFLNASVMHRDEAAVRRFKREAKAAVKIKSEHVARVRDVGTLESGAPYIVLEHLVGEDLSELIDSGKRISVRDATLYIVQACEALAQAHVLKIVHRDIKPQNLFLAHRMDGSPCVKVLDFGISKLLSGSTSAGVSLTKTNVIIGSPIYMSPECWQSAKNADMRSDIWGLTAILFELLAGRPPFQGETLPEICRAVQFDEPPQLAERRDDVSKELDDVISRGLSKSPSMRYQTVAELAHELAPFAGSAGKMLSKRIVRIIHRAGLLHGAVPIEGDSEYPTTSDAPPPSDPDGPAANRSPANRSRAPTPSREDADTMVSSGSLEHSQTVRARSQHSTSVEVPSVVTPSIPKPPATNNRAILLAGILFAGVVTIGLAVASSDGGASDPTPSTDTSSHATSTKSTASPDAPAASGSPSAPSPGASANKAAPAAKPKASATVGPTPSAAPAPSPSPKSDPAPVPRPVPRPFPKPVVPKPKPVDIFDQH